MSMLLKPFIPVWSAWTSSSWCVPSDHSTTSFTSLRVRPWLECLKWMLNCFLFQQTLRSGCYAVKNQFECKYSSFLITDILYRDLIHFFVRNWWKQHASFSNILLMIILRYLMCVFLFTSEAVLCDMQFLPMNRLILLTLGIKLPTKYLHYTFYYETVDYC